MLLQFSALTHMDLDVSQATVNSFMPCVHVSLACRLIKV